MSDRRGKAEPRVSVIVLTCWSAEATIACLESVAASSYDNLQFVVVCNGAESAVEEAVLAFADRAAARGFETRVLSNATNIGACAGRNQALAVADGEYVAFIDNDIVCRDPQWLHRAADRLNADASIGMIGPRVVSVAQSRLECAGYAIDPKGRVVALGVGRSVNDPRWKYVRPVQAVGNFIGRLEAIRAIGGFDTAFDPFGFENVDCSCRMRVAGYGVICDGESDLHHVGHLTTNGFEHQGRSILFAKSLLLRKRWRSLFEADGKFFSRLMEHETLTVRVEAPA